MKPAIHVSFAPAATDVRGALAKGVACLEAADVPSAALAAELLVLHVLQRDRTWIYAHPEYDLTPDEAAAYSELVERRREGVPTQYLTGRQEFWGIEFEVGPGVLIPRPETEHVVEVALERLDLRGTQAPRIADVGTGSGCIAIALARELPRARIVATDISAAALAYARRNAQAHSVSERIEFIETNLLDAYAKPSAPRQNRFDLIVSNPPYVARNDAATLAREVRDHEPAEALFAGDRGLDIYSPLIDAAARVLPPNGIFVAELGYNAARYVQSLLQERRWSDLCIRRDLAGIERVISAKFPAN